MDAVLIASPDPTHAALCLAAIEAGKPTLCEKPLAPTIRECMDVIAAETGTAPEIGFENGRLVLLLTETAERSARSGRAGKVSEVERQLESA